MKRRVSPTLIGAFVVGAVALAVGAIVLIGSMAWFSTIYRFVLYFDDSVDGLVLGAPVKLKGVQVGQVEQIKLAMRDDLPPRIAVVIGLDESRIESLSGSDSGFTPEEIEDAIGRGLRAKLASQSLLTGLLYVSLDYEADAPPARLQAKSGYPEIPTVPSRVEQVAQTAQDIFKKLQALDWQGLFDSISATMDGLRDLVADRETQNVTKQLNDTLQSVQELTRRLDGKIDPIASDLEDLAASARVALRSIDATMGDVRSMIEPESPLAYELSHTLHELSLAARSIRALTDSIDRDPSQLIFGRE
ncbi:MAG: MlaD family protein [Thermodesulfobacteriota bacterium]